MAFFTWKSLYRVINAVLYDEPDNEEERYFRDECKALMLSETVIRLPELAKRMKEEDEDAYRSAIFGNNMDLYIVYQRLLDYYGEEASKEVATIVAEQETQVAITSPIETVNYYLREIAIEIVQYTLEFFQVPEDLAHRLAEKIADGIQQTLYNLLFAAPPQTVTGQGFAGKKQKISGGSH